MVLATSQVTMWHDDVFENCFIKVNVFGIPKINCVQIDIIKTGFSKVVLLKLA